MQDIKDIIKAVENVYDNDTAFTILKDFERVLDQLDLYVYDNWEKGELVSGPEITRHFITCSFMWPREDMPDPMGGKRLTDYGCKVFFKKDQSRINEDLIKKILQTYNKKFINKDKTIIYLPNLFDHPNSSLYY